MKKYFTKEISIATVTLFSGFILYAGLNYMKGTNVFKHTNYYFVSIQNVNELQKSSPVYADGFKVGLVQDIDFGFENHKQITVKINLDKKMKVPSGSYCMLKSGLTSGAYLDLMLNKYVSDKVQPGDTIEGKTSVGLMDRVSHNVMPQLERIMPHLDSILTGMRIIVNHPALTQSLEQIATTTSNLARASNQLNTMLNDISPVISNLNKVSEDFATVGENIRKIDFYTTMKTVDNAVENLDSIIARLNDKNNSLGLLLNDRSLYLNLDSAAENASKLLLDLRQNPKRYVKLSLF
jgi:phospholipid/cholesterol/gamma-HCH transport system substrate-binding protein